MGEFCCAFLLEVHISTSKARHRRNSLSSILYQHSANVNSNHSCLNTSINKNQIMGFMSSLVNSYYGELLLFHNHRQPITWKRFIL